VARLADSVCLFIYSIAKTVAHVLSHAILPAASRGHGKCIADASCSRDRLRCCTTAAPAWTSESYYRYAAATPATWASLVRVTQWNCIHLKRVAETANSRIARRAGCLICGCLIRGISACSNSACLERMNERKQVPLERLSKRTQKRDRSRSNV